MNRFIRYARENLSVLIFVQIAACSIYTLVMGKFPDISTFASFVLGQFIGLVIMFSVETVRGRHASR